MDVLEELTQTGSQLDRSHVEKRIADWDRRLRNLYACIEEWLPADWVAADGTPVWLDAALMRRFEVSRRPLPTLILSRGPLRVRVEPRGLWVVGANGRVDLIRPDAHYMIVDHAELFTAPDWQVSSLSPDRGAVSFDRRRLAEMLA